MSGLLFNTDAVMWRVNRDEKAENPRVGSFRCLSRLLIAAKCKCLTSWCCSLDRSRNLNLFQGDPGPGGAARQDQHRTKTNSAFFQIIANRVFAWGWQIGSGPETFLLVFGEGCWERGSSTVCQMLTNPYGVVLILIDAHRCERCSHCSG